MGSTPGDVREWWGTSLELFFHAKAVEHTVRLNEFHGRRLVEATEFMVAAALTQFAFYHQSFDILNDMTKTMPYPAPVDSHLKKRVSQIKVKRHRQKKVLNLSLLRARPSRRIGKIEFPKAKQK
ncbi:hypothetical protein BJ742DRAFT_767940 [Cladochytrium replicatum]|nr:hypothetical protein BJ742DRAFT_767940 [Cladochytrium replicatum]